jgi:mono/diheme cytochrome c family protein
MRYSQSNCSVLFAGIILHVLVDVSLGGNPGRPTQALTGSVLTGSTPATSSARARISSRPEESVTFVRDVVPILMGKCVRCHNADTALIYNWLDYKTAYGDRKEIKKRVWDSWKGYYYKQTMPAGNGAASLAMTEAERMTIKRWVEAGAPYGSLSAGVSPKTKEQRIEQGKRLFSTICAACHQPTGQGIPGQFPPLAGSDFLNADKERAIGILLRGLQGEVVVNRRTFNNSMPPMPLADGDIASALTFVYSSFGNSGKVVTPEEVEHVREAQGNAVESDLKPRKSAPRQPSPWE